MSWTDFVVDITRFFQVYYTIISVIGIVMNVWAARDSYQDLKRLRLAKINSLVERTGRISYRDAVSIVFTHLVFFSLGLLGLTSQVRVTPDVTREILIIGFVVLASAVQTMIVVTQTLNQYDRISIRNTLIEEAREPREAYSAEG